MRVGGVEFAVWTCETKVDDMHEIDTVALQVADEEIRRFDVSME